MEKILLRYNGSVESMYTACQLANNGYEVHLLAFNNGALQAEELFQKDIKRLQDANGDSIIFEGVYGHNDIIKRLYAHYSAASTTEFATQQGHVTPTQMNCFICQVGMWVAACAFASAREFNVIAWPYRSTDKRISAHAPFRASMAELCKKYQIDVRYPIITSETVTLNDFNMRNSTDGPVCMLEMPPGDKDLVRQWGELESYYISHLAGIADNLVAHMIPIFQNLGLTDRAYTYREVQAE